MSGTIKTYTELTRLPTFQERFEYLKLDGSVGIETFGFDRYLNQIFITQKSGKGLEMKSLSEIKAAIWHVMDMKFKEILLSII